MIRPRRMVAGRRAAFEPSAQNAQLPVLVLTVTALLLPGVSSASSLTGAWEKYTVPPSLQGELWRPQPSTSVAGGARLFAAETSSWGTTSDNIGESGGDWLDKDRDTRESSPMGTEEQPLPALCGWRHHAPEAVHGQEHAAQAMVEESHVGHADQQASVAADEGAAAAAAAAAAGHDTLPPSLPVGTSLPAMWYPGNDVCTASNATAPISVHSTAILSDPIHAEACPIPLLHHSPTPAPAPALGLPPPLPPAQMGLRVPWHSGGVLSPGATWADWAQGPDEPDDVNDMEWLPLQLGQCGAEAAAAAAAAENGISLHSHPPPLATMRIPPAPQSVLTLSPKTRARAHREARLLRGSVRRDRGEVREAHMRHSSRRFLHMMGAGADPVSDADTDSTSSSSSSSSSYNQKRNVRHRANAHKPDPIAPRGRPCSPPPWSKDKRCGACGGRPVTHGVEEEGGGEWQEFLCVKCYQIDSWDKPARPLKGRCAACPRLAVYGPASSDTQAMQSSTDTSAAAALTHCPNHKVQGEVRLKAKSGKYCRFPKCKTIATFGDPTPRVRSDGTKLTPKPHRCSKHKELHDLDLRNRFCEYVEGGVGGSYGWQGDGGQTESGKCKRRAYVRTEEGGTTRWWCHSHVGVYTGVPSSEGSGDDSSHSARDTASGTVTAVGHGQGRELGRAVGIPSKEADSLPRWRPFFEAMSQVRSLGLRSQGAFEAWSKSGSKPRDIPSNPQEKYRGRGWVSWADFLGLQEEGRKWATFLEARAYIHRVGLQSQKEYKRWARCGSRPNWIPAEPRRTYEGEGWISWKDFLGTAIGQPPSQRRGSGPKRVGPREGRNSNAAPPRTVNIVDDDRCYAGGGGLTSAPVSTAIPRDDSPGDDGFWDL